MGMSIKYWMTYSFDSSLNCSGALANFSRMLFANCRVIRMSPTLKPKLIVAENVR